MSHQSEKLKDLISASLEGDRITYQKFLSTITPLLRSYLLKRIHKKEDIEDILQETLISIHRALPTYKKNSPVEPWIFAICRFRMNDYLRKSYKQKERELQLDKNMASKNEDVTKSVINREWMERALSCLNLKQRNIIIMMKVEGFTVSEVALKTGMSISAVKVTAHRAYKKIAKHIDKDDEKN